MRRRMTAREREEMMDEHIRQMGEPEPYRTLRLQKERIEHERKQAAEDAMYEHQAEQLRREIKAMGHRPAA